MKTWRVAGVMTGCVLLSVAGCPLDSGVLTGLLDSLDSLSSGTSGARIPDGTYSGTWRSRTEVYQYGNFYAADPNEGSVAAMFAQGAPVSPSGSWVAVGDSDTVDKGTIQLWREVSEVSPYAGGFEVMYEVSALWDILPLSGTQVVTYELNSDGSIQMHDTIRLSSLTAYDDGAWSMYVTTDGTLSKSGAWGSSGGNGSGGYTGSPWGDGSSSGGSSGGSTGGSSLGGSSGSGGSSGRWGGVWDDIMNRKSGKIRR